MSKRCEGCNKDFESRNIRRVRCDECRDEARRLGRSERRAEKSRIKRENTDSILCAVCNYRIYFFPGHQEGRPDLNNCLKCQGLIQRNCMTCQDLFWTRNRFWDCDQIKECDDCKRKYSQMVSSFRNGTPNPELINERYVLCITYILAPYHLHMIDRYDRVVREYPMHKDTHIDKDGSVDARSIYVQMYSHYNETANQEDLIVNVQAKPIIMSGKFAGKK